MKIYYSETMEFEGNIEELLERLEGAITDNIHIHNALDEFTGAPHQYVQDYVHGVMDAGSDISHDNVCVLVERVKAWAKRRYDNDK